MEEALRREDIGAIAASRPTNPTGNVRPYWAPHVILTLSLSKIGLPGTRTGIVVAPERIASAIGSHTAIMGLANSSVGQQLVLPWVESGRILQFGPKILRPFYEAKSRAAAAWASECLALAAEPAPDFARTLPTP